jgi:hypothetical protein
MQVIDLSEFGTECEFGTTIRTGRWIYVCQVLVLNWPSGSQGKWRTKAQVMSLPTGTTSTRYRLVNLVLFFFQHSVVVFSRMNIQTFCFTHTWYDFSGWCEAHGWHEPRGLQILHLMVKAYSKYEFLLHVFIVVSYNFFYWLSVLKWDL